jgi:2-keto-3-deoxy-L-rhamnonate aldolase RhmA
MPAAVRLSLGVGVTIAVLETPTAIANAEEIAAVPGVDVLLIGTNDYPLKWDPRRFR